MAISEFQLALIGAGATAVAGVWAYNSWQEYRVRKAADRVFRQDQEDVLATAPAAPDTDDAIDEPAYVAAAATAAEPREFIEPRIEPVFVRSEEEAAVAAVDLAIEDEAPAAMPLDEAPDETVEPLDETVLDPMIEFAVALPSQHSIAELQSRWREGGVEFRKRVRWIGWNAASGEWMEADLAADMKQAHAAIQLADRQGAIDREEFDAFLALTQSLGGDAAAASNEVLAHARIVDDLCAAVDIQIALHLVGRAGQSFAGSKLRGMLEAAGLPFADGRFHCVDDIGNSLFSVSHAGMTPFTPEQLRSGAITDATFWLDVPRVDDGGAAFDHMLAVARQLAEALDGALVDDQRNPLGDHALAGIRAKIVELQGQMAAHGIPAGGRRALRLFD